MALALSLALAQVIATPDTTGYLVLALVVFFGLLLLFVGSISLRARNLRKDETLIEQIKDDK